MRILLAIHNAYTDHTSGAAQSMRILMQWMANAGHDVRVLCSARFDARSIPTLVILREGTTVTRLVGAQPELVLRKRIDALLAG